jgi:Rrf2 family protein
MTPDSRLLHLPQSARYAVSAARYLAALPPGEYHMVWKIAQRTGLSSSYLAKILQRLTQEGVLKSRRGAKGGYRLRRPTTEITLADIVAASHRIEPVSMPCMIEARGCDNAGPCAMHKFVANTEAFVWRQLAEITLARMEMK